MKVLSQSFPDGGVIPPRFAFAKHHPETTVTLSDNMNPHLRWSDVPEGTRSFALICHDRDAPSVRDDANQPDREIPSDLPRTDFFHWVVVDIPADVTEIQEGEFNQGVVARGKRSGDGPHDIRQGLNDYTGWFEGDPDMDGRYLGYDGCAPPWNDSIPHRYRFTVYALDVDRVDVSGEFTGLEVREAIAGHVLAEASWEGSYTQNPRLL